MENRILTAKTKKKVSLEGSDPQTTILTIKEVSDLLRVHRSTVSRYSMSGELRSYLVGNRRLFRESDVWVFFDNQVDQRCVFGKEEQ